MPEKIRAVWKMNLKKKMINLKLSIIIILSGIIGAVIGASISSKLNVNILKKIFGVFLLCVAIYEIYKWYITYIKNKNEHNKSKQLISDNRKDDLK